jgi:hypothetical protein
MFLKVCPVLLPVGLECFSWCSLQTARQNFVCSTKSAALFPKTIKHNIHCKSDPATGLLAHFRRAHPTASSFDLLNTKFFLGGRRCRRHHHHHHHHPQVVPLAQIRVQKSD